MAKTKSKAKKRSEALKMRIEKLEEEVAWLHQSRNQLEEEVENRDESVGDLESQQLAQEFRNLNETLATLLVEQRQNSSLQLPAPTPQAVETETNAITSEAPEPNLGQSGFLASSFRILKGLSINERAQWGTIIAQILAMILMFSVGYRQYQVMGSRLENSSMTQLYRHSFLLSKSEIEYPELRMMFYGTLYDKNKNESPDAIDQARLDVFCEQTLDFFELILMEFDTIDVQDREFWQRYIGGQFRRSDVLSKSLIDNQEYYSDALLELRRTNR